MLRGTSSVSSTRLVFVRIQKRDRNQDLGGAGIVLTMQARQSFHSQTCAAGFTPRTALGGMSVQLTAAADELSSVFMYRRSALTFTVPKAAQAGKRC